MKAITIEWLKSARDDLMIIEMIIGEGSLAQQPAFHAQQAIEKSFKAIIEEHELKFIKTHSFETLKSQIRDVFNLEMDLNLLKELDQLYIDARYPGDLGLLPNGKPGKSEALIFQKTAIDVVEKVNGFLNE